MEWIIQFWIVEISFVIVGADSSHRQHLYMVLCHIWTNGICCIDGVLHITTKTRDYWFKSKWVKLKSCQNKKWFWNIYHNFRSTNDSPKFCISFLNSLKLLLSLKILHSVVHMLNKYFDMFKIMPARNCSCSWKEFNFSVGLTGEWLLFRRCGLVFGFGYLLHFLPCFVYTRTLFLYHYMPALIFKLLLFAALMDHFYACCKM